LGKEFKIGDWVEVRSKEDILATLDNKGCVDGMPFMPEMLQFCGKRYRVHKSAHKTCDYSSSKIRSRRLHDTVHLETRCDGSAHDGCQAGCLLYWKVAWLKHLNENPASYEATDENPQQKVHTTIAANRGCTESDLHAHTKVLDPDGESPTYICQTTNIPLATSNLEWWDLRQYIQDYWSGNVRLGRVFNGLSYSLYYNLSQAGIGVGRPMRWLYNKVRFLWRGSLWPRTPGRIPEGEPTPSASLNLQPGELARVKPHEEILKTVTTANLNRGMHWDAELVPYCGGTYRVLARVSKIIHERTGKMQEMKTPCIILDSVVCQARYSACRMFCPKAMYPYWREIWLERAGPEEVLDPSATKR
jgi:hypothetical protein